MLVNKDFGSNFLSYSLFTSLNFPGSLVESSPKIIMPYLFEFRFLVQPFGFLMFPLALRVTSVLFLQESTRTCEKQNEMNKYRENITGRCERI